MNKSELIAALVAKQSAEQASRPAQDAQLQADLAAKLDTLRAQYEASVAAAQAEHADSVKALANSRDAEDAVWSQILAMQQLIPDGAISGPLTAAA